jgi:predicted phosphodiesterase
MAFALLFDRNHKVLLVRFGRTLNRQTLEAMVQAAREFVAVHGNCDGIVDFSAVEKVDVDVAYLRAYGGSPRVMAGAKRVLVAPDDEMFGVARLYGLHQSTRQGEEPMVVRTLQAAYDLLGLQDPDFQPFEIGGQSPD